jgi:uncharacterized protein YjiS (DUF1127 family)
MTARILTDLAPQPAWLTWFARVLAEVLAGIRDGRRMEQRYFALSRLSDEELARLGLKRQDIPQAVAGARTGS